MWCGVGLEFEEEWLDVTFGLLPLHCNVLESGTVVLWFFVLGSCFLGDINVTNNHYHNGNSNYNDGGGVSM